MASPPPSLVRATAAGIVLLLLGGLTGLLVVSDGDAPAAVSMAQVRDFVARARTASFTAVERNEFQPGDGRFGDSGSSRTRISGQVRLPDAARLVKQNEGVFDEAIVLGADVYTRSAESRADLDQQPWAHLNGNLLPGFDTEGAGEGGSEGLFAPEPLAETGRFMGGVFGLGAPVGLAELLGRLGNAERVGSHRLRATLSVEDLLPPGLRRLIGGQDEFKLSGRLTATIDYSDAGTLDVLDLRSETTLGGETSIQRTTYRFTDWGTPVTITAPAAAVDDFAD